MTQKQRSVDSAKWNFPEGKRSYLMMWYCHTRRSGRILIPSNQATNCHPQSTQLGTTVYRALVSRPDFHIMTPHCYTYLLRQTFVFKGRTLTFSAGNWTLKRKTFLLSVDSPLPRKNCALLMFAAEFFAWPTWIWLLGVTFKCVMTESGPYLFC